MLRSRLVSLLAAILLPFALSFAARTAAQTPPAEGTASVSGIVTLKGEPARGAIVALQMSGSSTVQAVRATTDDAGRFAFERLKAGRYTLSALAPGYVTPSAKQYGMPGRTVNLSEGERVEDVGLALVAGGVITGRVTDARGNPVVGESLHVERISEQGRPEQLFLGSLGRMYSTDDRGIYRLYGMPAGRYLLSIGFAQRPNTITITSQRVYYPRTYHPDAASEAEARVVEVSEGQETAGIDITIPGLKKNYDVSGRVVYAETGAPAVGVQIAFGVISAQRGSIGPYGSTNERTNLEGEFRMQSILPGKYAAFVQPEGNENFYSDPVQFEVADADVSGMEIKLHRGSSISGIAVVEGATDPALAAKLVDLPLYITITSTGLTAPSGASVKPAANGSFRFTGLRPGRARISTVVPGAMHRFSLLRVERNGVVQPEGIEVGAGEEITGVRLVFASGAGSVRGSVRLTGGAAPDGIQLSARARRIDSGLNAGTIGAVDARGLFRIDHLPPGDYEIILSSSYSGGAPPPGFEAFNKLLANTKERFTISGEGEARVDLVVDLSRREN